MNETKVIYLVCEESDHDDFSYVVFSAHETFDDADRRRQELQPENSRRFFIDTTTYHFIAPAPDLLQALRLIDANAAESVEWIRRVAHEAIAKATGE